MAPTRIGRPTAAEAAQICWLVVSSRNGSTAVEFSGQTTKSGRGTRPAAMSAARPTVASTWFCVTCRKS